MVGVASIGKRRDDLRDHFARPFDLDPVAGAKILFSHQLEVVQGREFHDRAANLDWFEHGIRVERTSAADVHPDVEQSRDRDVRRELAGDRPPRLAPSNDAELFLQRERIDLDHAAVDGEVQGAAHAVLNVVGPPLHLGERAAMGPVRRDRDAPRSECVEQSHCVVKGRESSLPGPAAAAYPKNLSGRVAVMLESSWRSEPAADVAGVREDRVAGRRPRLVHSFEQAERHVYLATDLEDRGRGGPSAAKPQRDLAYRAEVGGHVLADLPLPRVAPVTSTPSRYVRLTAAPSIFSSAV